MDRSHATPRARFFWCMACLFLLLPSTGCLHQLLATGVYLVDGGNRVDADCEALEKHRVVVFCRPPASSEYSHAGASRDLAREVSNLLRENVPGVDVVDTREVDQWLDENDSLDYKALGNAVDAEMVLMIEMDHFDLFNGPTLYQGNADIRLAVYDLVAGNKLVFEEELNEMRFPVNSGIPRQDKPVRTFQKQYVGILAGTISRKFYKHDPHADFAIDARANR